MTESVNNLIQMLNLVKSVESYTLQSYQETLILSDNLGEFKNKSPYKPPFAINYLEYYGSQEPVTSWILRHIFAYSYDGRHPFFESFVEIFLKETGFKKNWIEHPIIEKDHEYKGIDILIRDEKYAIIIENKLKGARFQLNQLARYIAKMRNEGYDDELIFVVILPKVNISEEGIIDSAWKLPSDWESTNRSRKCRVDDYSCWCDYADYKLTNHCKECQPLRTLFKRRSVVIHKKLSSWLYDCVVNNTISIPEYELRKQYVLTSAVLQFVDFLNYLYQIRETDKYKMDIQRFLSDNLQLNQHNIADQLSLVEEKKNDANDLVSQLNTLYWNKIKEYIAEIGKKYHIHIIPVDNNGYYFYGEVMFGGILVKVVLGNDSDGMGDYCQIETKQRRKIPAEIKNDFDISAELSDPDNRNDCIWRYDSYKECLLRFDRVLGRLLDLNKDRHT